MNRESRNAFLSEAAVEQALLDQLRALDYSIEREGGVGAGGQCIRDARTFLKEYAQ